MIPYEPEESFICDNCGKVGKISYMSPSNPGICIFCDEDENYDDEGDYYEDDSDSPWNE